MMLHKKQVHDMNRIVLHIGLPKTGTTWLQSLFFPCQNEINYIDIAPQNNLSDKHPALVELIRISRIAHVDLSDADLDRSREIIERYLDPERINVFSNENRFPGVHTVYSGGDIYSVIKNLHVLYPRMKIVLILRNQMEMLSSLYLQRLDTGGECGTFRQYLDSCVSSLIPYLKYEDLIVILQDVFTETNVYISTYENLKADPVQYLKNLSAFMGLSVPNLDIQSKRLVNRSLSLHSMYVALSMNRVCRAVGIGNRHPWRRRVIDLLKRMDVVIIDKYSLRNKPRNPYEKVLTQYYAESNTKLSQRLGIDLTGLGYP